MNSLFYAFDHAHEVQGDELKALVGGKGAGLAAMTELGIPVPPGFTIPTPACLAYLDNGWSQDLGDAVRSGVRGIETAVGRRLGDPVAPLLVSVRSGAKFSMPGMMDTVLNAGMTEAVARGFAERSGDAAFAWDTYRRAIVSFAQVVLGATADELAALDQQATQGAVSEEAGALAFAAAVAQAGYSVPTDPHAQIDAAVEAVFRSWHSDRARAYRDREGIDHALGTAATVQAMVFGNMGDRSGTGVAFSRCPSTGEIGLMGDFLIGAQGEDVVAGTHQTMPLGELETQWPEIWAELNEVAQRLETDACDMVDLEFTVEDGRLWLLQTRVAKRSPAAVFRTAVEMANDPAFPVDRATAVDRCRDHLTDPPVLADPNHSDESETAAVIAAGLAASPGRAVGVVSLDPDDAVLRSERGERVILVRQETSPADIHGMGASSGLVTTLGGMVSHAAVVARSWGLAAVVGCAGIELTEDAMICGDTRIESGATITVDGDAGRVLLGEHRGGTMPLPEVEIIQSWARADGGAAGDPEQGDAAVAAGSGVAFGPDDCLRLIALKGMAGAASLTEPIGASEEAIAAVIAELEAQELVAEIMPGRMRATEAGAARVAELYAAEAGIQPLCDAALDTFHEPNMLLKKVVTDWQVRVVDGEDTMNDHADAAYDQSVLDRLRSEVHAGVGPIIAQLAEQLPRLARYHERLEEALAKLDANDHQYVAHPLKDSYHTVWFELHEELITLAGRNRKDETAAGRA
jgi:pyruvate,orthophosphate dikinase